MSKRIEVRDPSSPWALLYAIVDDGDYDWLSIFTWHAHFPRFSKTVYAKRGEVARGQSRLMHKMITGFEMTDHKNCVGLDNRRDNLRETSHSKNFANKAKWSGVYSSQYKGVYFDKRSQMWDAYLKPENQRRLYLGAFETEEEAARVYDCAALAHYGEFARLNLPQFTGVPIGRMERYCANETCGKALASTMRRGAKYCSRDCANSPEVQRQRKEQREH